MKKIIITMEDNTHEWLRAQAALERISVSYCVRNLIEQAREHETVGQRTPIKIKRKPGAFKGKMWLADDWDSPETNRMINDMMLASRILPDEPDLLTVKDKIATRAVKPKKRASKHSAKRKP